MRSIGCLFFVLLIVPVRAQVDLAGRLYEQDAWMLKALLMDSLPDGPVFNRWHESRGPVFWVNDLPKKEEYIGSDVLLMRNGHLFAHVPGTGRLYAIYADESSGVRAARYDSTRYEGYNNAAFTFVYQDTVYSLGGYGFWQLNGHLRFFNDTQRSWDIVPLNIKVLAREDGVVSHLADSGFYYLSTPDFDHSIRAASDAMELSGEGGQLFYLDLRRKNWHSQGDISVEFASLKGYQQIGTLPWGPLVYGQTGNKFHLYLFCFKKNQIFEIGAGEMRSRLLNALWYDGKGKSRRVFQYYKDSSVYALSSSREKVSIPLSFTDFRPTGIRIYDGGTVFTSSVLYMSSIFLVFGCVAGVWLIRKRRNRSARSHQHITAGGNVKWFDELETDLLAAFVKDGAWALTIDAVDTILGTSAKSKDIQNHKRSTVIRSINTKYTQFTGRDVKLITTRRLPLDRRMYEYFIAESERQVLQENM